MIFENPIIKGFSPDPSICVVGEDYYLVTSTFAYFPGIPIYHSQNLVQWTQIGNVLNREEQLNLKDATHSSGIYAPSIRYYKGIFYVITTNVAHNGNFIVTAQNPAGPWSNPHFIENAPGIDPSLFFDDDGRSYYVGTRPNPKGTKYDGDWEVWLQEIDLKNMKLIGTSSALWKGALRDVVWPEGPHLYKKDGYYYLMIAEGGTGPNHCITISRSNRIDCGYIGNKNNPILTHRHLGNRYFVQNVGHGDLVKTSNGKWYMTCLASRIYEGYSNLGRETFLAKVIWEDGWPIVNPGEGRLLARQEISGEIEDINLDKKDKIYIFDRIQQEFLFLRNPEWDNYKFGIQGRRIRMIPTKKTIQDIDSPTYLGIRQQAINYSLAARFLLGELKSGEAGLAIIQNDKYSVRISASQENDETVLKVVTITDGREKVIKSQKILDQDLVLGLQGRGQKISAYFKEDKEKIFFCENIDAHYLSSEIAGGFVGCTFGAYTTSKSKKPGYVEVDFLALENR